MPSYRAALNCVVLCCVVPCCVLWGVLLFEMCSLLYENFHCAEVTGVQLMLVNATRSRENSSPPALTGRRWLGDEEYNLMQSISEHIPFRSLVSRRQETSVGYEQFFL